LVLRSRDLDAEQETKAENDGPRASRLSVIMSTGFPVFLAFIGFRAVGVVGSTTFVPTFLVRERGVSEAVASLIFGLGPFMGIIGSLFGGYLGDRVGAKRILSSAIVGSAVSLLCLALLSNIDSVVLTYLMFALCNNTVWSPMNTMVVDLIPVTERGLGFSMYFLTEGLVEAVSPTIAVQVIGLSSVTVLFLFGSGLVFASLAILHRLHYPQRLSPVEKSEKRETEH
jgi:predicted MFS family arabinose efflux permease